MPYRVKSFCRWVVSVNAMKNMAISGVHGRKPYLLIFGTPPHRVKVQSRWSPTSRRSASLGYIPPLDLLHLPVGASGTLVAPPVLPLMAVEALVADAEVALVADEPPPCVGQCPAAVLARDVLLHGWLLPDRGDLEPVWIYPHQKSLLLAKIGLEGVVQLPVRNVGHHPRDCLGDNGSSCSDHVAIVALHVLLDLVFLVTDRIQQCDDRFRLARQLGADSRMSGWLTCCPMLI